MEKEKMQKEMKATIKILISDLRCAITFRPDRTRDLCLFMEAYLAETGRENREEERECILGHLVDCAQGREYPDPRAGQYRFTHDDVDRLEQRLDDLLHSAERGDRAAFDAADAELAAFQSGAGSTMMDTWRREMIQALRTAGGDMLGPTEQAPKAGPRMEAGW